MEALHPIQRCGCIAQFTDAVVECPLATSHAPEVEAQNRESAFHERLVKRLGDAIVHRAPALRVGMKDHRDRGARAGRRAETPFKAAFRARKDNVGHGTLLWLWPRTADWMRGRKPLLA